MTEPTATPTAPRRGVLRLLVLALTLAGFVAMHGLASAGGGEAHCGSPAFLLIGGAHPHLDGPAVDGDPAPVGGHVRGAEAPAPRDADESMVGCLLALLGTLVSLGLRLLGGFPAGTTPARTRRAPAFRRTARAPPDPLFLSLCVLRR